MQQAEENSYTPLGAAFSPIQDWILQAGMGSAGVAELLQGFCERVDAAGFPLQRVYLGINTLHPTYRSFGYIWRRGGADIVAEPFLRSAGHPDAFYQSPVFHLVSGKAGRIRRKLDEPAEVDFPIYEDFRSDGGSEYYARIIGFDDRRELGRHEDGNGLIFTMLTDAPGGFDEVQLKRFERLVLGFSLAIKARVLQQISHSIAETYLGLDAGHRVLRGEIDRGKVQSLRAVIYFADLRGFTAKADVVPADQLVTMLDDYLDAMSRPVLQAGGEVLKFMGDGILGVFPIEGTDSSEECHVALHAAIDAAALSRDLSEKRKREGLEVMDLDIALHVGDVLYGNVGAEGRLDFTVIGPAVNEASRLEALCRPLNHHLLVSDDFQRGAGVCREKLVSLGVHHLRGVREDKEIFGLDPAIMASCLNSEQTYPQ